MSKSSENPDFYDALKKAQPLAFLASFSLIIGIISSSDTSTSIPDIQSDAILAGFMFIFSFITAVVSQITKKSVLISRFTRFSQYFFFTIGIIYFLFVALKFSETLLQIPTIFTGWLIIFLGIGLFVRIYPIKRKLWHGIKMLNEIEDKICYPTMGLAFFILGGSFVASALFQQNFDWVTIVVLSLSVGISGFLLLFACEMFRFVQLVRRMRR